MTDYRYDQAVQLCYITNALGQITKLGYNPLSLVVRETEFWHTPGEIVTQTGFDAHGNPRDATDAFGVTA